jgi:hypothetical protein
MSLADEAVVSAQPSALRRWAGIFYAYFSSHTVVQLLGIASGLLFINFMPVHELALYTLASSMTIFFTFATDLGSTASLLHFFHRAAKEETSFHPYHEAVLSLRHWGFVVGAGVVAVALPVLAAGKGFTSWEVGLALGGVLLCVWFQIRVSLRLLALRLKAAFGRSYRAEIAGSGLRLGLAGLMAATGWLQAWLGILTVAIGSALTAGLARPEQEVPRSVAPEGLGIYRRKIFRYLLPTLPAAAYFAVQGPLIVWLSATFAGVRTIAEVGALGRLALVVGLFSGLIGTVFLPRLVHITDDRLYLRRYLQFGTLLAGVAATLALAAAAAPQLFLLLLGPKFAGLHSELLLVVAASGLSLLDGYAVNVNLARSWTRWQGAALAIQIAVQALLVVQLPLSTTFNILLFNLVSAGIALALQLVTTVAGFTRPRWVYWS